MSSKKPNIKKIKMLCTQGSKGGVGKTLFAAQVAAWLKVRGHAFVALDLDTENANHAGLSSYVKEAEKVDIHTIETLDILLNASQVSEIVLVDMPAATGYLLFDWFSKMHGICEEIGMEFVFFCLVTSAPGTVENVLHWADALGDKVTYVAVKNPMKDETAKFEIWDRAVEVQEFKKEFTCHEMILPSIREDVLPYLELESLTLQDALLTETNKESLPTKLAKFSVQQHIRRWNEHIFGQLDELAQKGVLLP